MLLNQDGFLLEVLISLSLKKKFEKYLGGGNAIALTNGTNALQIGLMALGIKKGDEVILPNFTFGGTINAILNAGAVPVIADVCKNNWTLNSINVQKKLTKKLKQLCQYMYTASLMKFLV